MKFFSDSKEDLSVISKVTKKRIALFENGVFETDDPETIRRLKTKFRFENPKVLSNLANFVKLRKKVAELGINTKGMKKKDLLEALIKKKKAKK